MRVAWLLPMMLVLSGCAQDSGLDDTDEDGAPDPFARTPALEFREAVDLGSKAGVMGSGVGAFGTSCDDSADDGDCGLGEPSIEVDGLGQVYISGVCCLTVSPPVYVSRDGGATFETLDHPVRDAWGIEGDFAIDQEGRVYFSDIEVAGTFQVTVWDHEGNDIRHTKWPAPPLVDRDWIRAEGDGTAYYVYNTGTDTNIYKTTDAAQTWSPTAIHSTGFGLGNAAILPGEVFCVIGGSSDGQREAHCSGDGGSSWGVERTKTDAGGSFPVPVFDEAGHLYVVGNAGQRVSYSWREPHDTDLAGGEDLWHEGVTVGPNGTHRMPWAAAGADGAMAIAWYGTENETIGPDTEWYLYVAASRNATAADPRWDWTKADPDPIFTGELGRDLLDFLQVEIGPDGAIHVAYSDQSPATGPDGNEERLTYVRSEPSPLAATDYFWGPEPA